MQHPQFRIGDSVKMLEGRNGVIAGYYTKSGEETDDPLEAYAYMVECEDGFFYGAEADDVRPVYVN
jgi:hypothetical protein